MLALQCCLFDTLEYAVPLLHLATASPHGPTGSTFPGRPQPCLQPASPANWPCRAVPPPALGPTSAPILPALLARAWRAPPLASTASTSPGRCWGSLPPPRTLPPSTQRPCCATPPRPSASLSGPLPPPPQGPWRRTGPVACAALTVPDRLGPTSAPILPALLDRAWRALSLAPRPTPRFHRPTSPVHRIDGARWYPVDGARLAGWPDPPHTHIAPATSPVRRPQRSTEKLRCMSMSGAGPGAADSCAATSRTHAASLAGVRRFRLQSPRAPTFGKGGRGGGRSCLGPWRATAGRVGGPGSGGMG
jgi:hypothetical protein